MDVTDFFAKNGKYPRWGNVDLADARAAKGHFTTLTDFEAYVDFLEAWDEALEEDMDRNTDMCIWSDIANVGYGPDEVMTCRKKTTHNVTYESYDPESDTWYNVSIHVCAFHAGAIKSDIEGNSDKSDMMRNWHISELQDNTVSSDK